MKIAITVGLMVIAQILSKYDEALGTIIGLLALIIIAGCAVVFLAKAMAERGV